MNRYDFDMVNAEYRGEQRGEQRGLEQGIDIGIAALNALVEKGLLPPEDAEKQIADIKAKAALSATISGE